MFYLLALVPVAIGFVLWMTDRHIIWREWLLASGAGFLLAAIFHLIAVVSMTTDIETWSGQIETATHYPQWIEEYQESHEMVVGHDKDGNAEYMTWYTTEHRTHSENWEAKTTTGETRDIGRDFFEQIRKNFNDLTTEKPHKSGFDGGDPNIYVSYNRTGFIYPTTTTRHFQNKLKGAPSLFRFTEAEPSPSKFTFSGGPHEAVLYEWPENKYWLASDRLRGTAPIYFNLLEFDRMNSRLGPVKKVNVIMVGFPANKPEDYGRAQQAKWIGGKKNDLVITFGGGGKTNPPVWVYVFGWTERDNCKRNLEKIMREQSLGAGVLVDIEREIRHSYQIKDWTKFDYVSIEPPRWSIWLFVGLLVGTQFVLYLVFHCNDDDQQNPNSPFSRMLAAMNARKTVTIPKVKIWPFS